MSSDTSCMLGAHFGTAVAAEARLRDVCGGEGEVREFAYRAIDEWA